MGKLADCERIVQEAIDGLGGLDVIVSNAVGFAVHAFRPYDEEEHKHCHLMASSDVLVQRAGRSSRVSGILMLLVKPNGTRY